MASDEHEELDELVTKFTMMLVKAKILNVTKFFKSRALFSDWCNRRLTKEWAKDDDDN